MTAAAAPQPVRAGPRPASPGGRPLAAGIAALALGAGLWLAAAYPIAPRWVLAAFLLWSALAFLRPAAWLVLVPAALPLLGFASWTGWLIFEEFDLVLLGSAVGGYARAAFAPEAAGGRQTPGPADSSDSAKSAAARYARRIPVLSVILLGLFLLSQLVALSRGIADAGGWRFSWDQGYDEPLNSLRLGKSYLLALLMLPLFQRQLAQSTPSASSVDPEHAATRAFSLLSGGMALGLAGAALAALWERRAFPGLLDFSSDYRTTALFWEMHVGGAALDGFLALTVPFALRELLAARSRLRWLASGVLLLLAGYACLTTFSRGVYLAVAVSLGLLAVLGALRSPRGADGGAQRSVLRYLLQCGLFALAAGAAFLVFRSGGYRALLAVLGVVALTLPLGVLLRGASPALWLAGFVAGGTMAAGGFLLSWLLPKGPYVVYGLAFAFALAFIALYRRGAPRTLLGAALASYVWTLLAAAYVALSWGAMPAFSDAVVVLAGVLALLCYSAVAARPPWPEALRAQAAAFAGLVVLAGAMVVFSGGAYMSGRFSTSERDFDGRLEHWSKGLALLQSPGDWWLGKGLGRFPASYFYGAHGAEFPGSYKVADAPDGSRHLLLSGPQHLFGFGELFRVSQRVPVVRDGPYRLTLDARASEAARLHLEVCEKHLLYSAGCAIVGVDIRPAAGEWQRVAVQLDTQALSGGSWYAPRLAFFSLAVETRSRVVEIADVNLLDPQGRNLLRNGDFAAGMERWFFTSDRHHLPWHIKNMFLNVLFEQGIVGLLLFLGLLCGALWRLAAGSARAHPLAPYLAASLLGFALVGMFDSLLDVPRVAFLFYFLTTVSLLLRPARR